MCPITPTAKEVLVGFFFDGHRPQPPFGRIDGREPAPKRAEESYPDPGLRMPRRAPQYDFVDQIETISPVHNPRVRTDSEGKGWFGASRGRNREHRGVDLEAVAGTLVRSPVNGVVTEDNADAYKNPTPVQAEFKAIKILGDDGRLYVLRYVKPRDVNDNVLTQKRKRVTAGEAVGSVQNIAKAYSDAMTNHIHVEVWEDGKHIDPTLLVQRWTRDWNNRSESW
jgi:murein DD-endopeptidase MepM/ murein hydrolase activator NlpD